MDSILFPPVDDLYVLSCFHYEIAGGILLAMIYMSDAHWYFWSFF